jgi:hypothetical protein
MEEAQYRFNCEKCNYHNNSQAAYNNHLISSKHLTGKKATRCDKKSPEKCPHCNFVPKSYTNFMQHTLIYHSSKEERQEKFLFYCDKCDYGCFAIKSFNIHKESKKHIYLCG